jgi:Uma2 family endonuclease
MTLEAEIGPLRRSLRLPAIVDLLQAQLAKEAAARRKFYEEMTDEQKVEFIEGEVILHSPARWAHTACRKHIEALLDAYVERHSLGLVSGEKSLCVFPRNDYEPDVVFFGKAKAATIQPRTMKFPVPDLAVEILSESTARRDRGVKFEDFAINGVDEYWIVDPEAEVVEQYLVRDGAYELKLKTGAGEIVSRAIAGLRLPIRAFFDSKEKTAALRALLAA